MSRTKKSTVNILKHSLHVLVNVICALICIQSITLKILLSILLFFPQELNVGIFSCVIQLSDGISIAV